ncbi:MAG: ABC transporter ATP-binding protein/permease [Gemmatimonadetes bacterium]|nr:ABC transporter ATP-binding protein/permease [Gemmatimonadota bacterium]
MKELQALLPYLRRYRVSIAAGLAAVFVANAFSLAAPYFIKQGIDALARPDVSPGLMLRYAGLVVLTAVLGGIGRYWMRELLNGVSRRVEFDLANDFFRHLLKLDAGFYAATPTGDIMSRATNDISAVRMVAGPAYMYLVNTLVGTVFSLTLMVWIDPWLTLWSMIPMLALPPVTLAFGQLIHQRFTKIQEQYSAMSTMAQENLAGVRIVKAYGREAQQAGRFRDLSHQYLQLNMHLARVSGLFHPLLALLSGFAMVVALLIGGRAVMRGAISTGEFVAFMLYLGMLSWPMIALGWVVNLYQRGAASMGRINRIMALDPVIRDPAAPRSPATVRGEIEFREVSFRYPGTERWVIRNVSFRVPAGSMLAVVGATGAGKSTLVALLARLFDPVAGEILLDGVPIREMPLAGLRAAIGMVPQDAFLFSDTIRENLGLGVDEEDEAQMEKIRRAAAIAQLDSTVSAFPLGYETLLGERGVNLSGGQKQRATLARAIARDPRVLVLDDALSAVDTHTEAEILSGLREVMRDRTSVIVSHRVTAVMGADLIVVLENGTIREQGTHAELLQSGGSYATLLHRQLLADRLADEGVLAPVEDEI